MALLLLAAIVLFINRQEAGSCPVTVRANHTNECLCYISDIKCTELDQIPEFLESGDVWSGIYMQEQEIGAIPEESFVNLKVKKIVLNNNPIGNAISLNAWTGVESILEELHLSSCRIMSLQPSMLLGMSQLRILHIYNNQLENISKTLFQGAPNLEELLLWGNKIRDLDDSTFDTLHKLRKLDLDKNNILELRKDMFKHLSNLESLHIGENNIRSVMKNTFSYLTRLKVLNLDKNGLEFLFPGAFNGLNNLVNLGLQYNDIGFIPDDLFKSLRNLLELRLQSNKMEHIWFRSFQGLNKLQKLFLTSNIIQSIPEGVFQRLIHLSQLYLDHNKLSTLKKCLFSRKSNITTLSLVGNPIQCDCRLTWMVDLHDRGVAVHGSCGLIEPEGNLTAIVQRENYENCSFSNFRCIR